MRLRVHLFGRELLDVDLWSEPEVEEDSVEAFLAEPTVVVAIDQDPEEADRIAEALRDYCSLGWSQ